MDEPTDHGQTTDKDDYIGTRKVNLGSKMALGNNYNGLLSLFIK